VSFCLGLRAACCVVRPVRDQHQGPRRVRPGGSGRSEGHDPLGTREPGGVERDQQKERQMALETRRRSTWRRQKSITSWLRAWRVIAGLRISMMRTFRHGP